MSTLWQGQISYFKFLKIPFSLVLLSTLLWRCHKFIQSEFFWELSYWSYEGRLFHIFRKLNDSLLCELSCDIWCSSLQTRTCHIHLRKGLSLVWILINIYQFILDRGKTSWENFLSPVRVCPVWDHTCLSESLFAEHA